MIPQLLSKRIPVDAGIVLSLAGKERCYEANTEAHEGVRAGGNSAASTGAACVERTDRALASVA